MAAAVNDTPNATPTPADLQAARDSAVGLVEYLRWAIGDFLGCGRDPVVLTPPGRERIPAVVKRLDDLIRAATANVTAVRDELTVASGRVRSTHHEVITFAGNFRGSANLLIAGDGTHKPENVQAWLADAAQSVDAFLSGVVCNPRACYSPSSGIDFEMNRAAALRVVQNPQHGWIRCAPSDRSVWLDGRRVMSGLDEDVFAYLDALVGCYPNRISFREIQGRSVALQGVNQARFKRKLQEKLPRQIFKLIHRTAGHVLRRPV